MKKMFFLMLTLMVLSVASAKAQVTIGSDKDPDPSAVLDLRSNTRGLLLPRVALLSTLDITTIPNPVAGLVVYNTIGNGSGLTAVTPGTYSFSGGKWQYLESVPAATTYPAPIVTLASSSTKLFNFFRMQETYGDPEGPAVAINPITFTVNATGTGTLKYQWYKKNFDSTGDIKISDATTNIYTTPAEDLTTWGLKSYYCLVTDDYTSTFSPFGEVAIGCGAKTISGGWLSFMCYNLGAKTSISPFTTVDTDPTVDDDVKGYLFQWGRQADGHEKRTSETVSGPSNQLDENGQIPTSDLTFSGKFILNSNGWRTPSDIYLWSIPKTPSDPCPDGWRIPSITEWFSILDGDNKTRNLEDSKTNHLRFASYGVLFEPEIGTPTLGLVLGATRNPTSGVLNNNRQLGLYWASGSGPANNNAWRVSFTSSFYQPFGGTSQSTGGSVRCVHE